MRDSVLSFLHHKVQSTIDCIYTRTQRSSTSAHPLQDIEPLLDSQGNPVTDSRGNPIPKVLPAAAGLLAHPTLGHDMPG
jgi:hypothetical protein